MLPYKNKIPESKKMIDLFGNNKRKELENKIIVLNKKIEEKEKYNTELVRDNNLMCSDLEKKDKEIKEKDKTIEGNIEYLRHLEGLLDIKHEKYNNLEKNYGELKEEITELNEKYEDAVKGKEHWKSQSEKMAKMLEKKDEKIKEKNEHINLLGSLKAEAETNADEYYHRLNGLKGRNAMLVSDKEELNEKLKKAIEEKEAAEKQSKSDKFYKDHLLKEVADGKYIIRLTPSKVNYPTFPKVKYKMPGDDKNE